MVILSLVFLVLIALLLLHELKGMRYHFDKQRRLSIDLDLWKNYSINLQTLLEVHAGTDIARALITTIKGDLVLFGFNSVARFLIKEISRNGGGVKCVIENKEEIRGKVTDGSVVLLSEKDALEFIALGDTILICILNHNAYSLAQRLTSRFNNIAEIVLLEDILRKTNIHEDK